MGRRSLEMEEHLRAALPTPSLLEKTREETRPKTQGRFNDHMLNRRTGPNDYLINERNEV